MRPSMHHVVFLDAVYEHGHGAFAHLLERYPESAVQREFEKARRNGWIECDGKLSRATLTDRTRKGVEIGRALRGVTDAPNDAT